MLNFIVYAIKSVNRNYIYVGLTSNLKKRMHYHNAGYERTTSSYKPFTLFYTKDFDNQIDARLHEKFLKGGSGKEFLKSLLLNRI